MVRPNRSKVEELEDMDKELEKLEDKYTESKFKRIARSLKKFIHPVKISNTVKKKARKSRRQVLKGSKK